MAGEFTKPTSVTPAIVGNIANPDEYNQNIAAQSKSAIVGIDEDGNFSDVNIGDETLGTNGTLIVDIKLREGGALKFYNSSGVHQNDVNLGQASRSLLGQTYLPKPITIANNSSDSEHDIDFGDGIIEFDDGTGQAVATALTKQLDASWVAGTGQGGLDTGSIATNTWYYCFAIYNPTTLTADFLFSASYSSPTLPSGYTKKEYRGAVLTDASSNIRTATYNLNYVHFHSTLTSYNGTATTTRTFKSISTPPIPVIANITATMDSSSVTTASAWVTSPIETDKQPVLDETSNSNMEGNLKSRWDTYTISTTRITPLIRSNDATVGIRCTSTNPRFKIYTHGFYDLNIKF